MPKTFQSLAWEYIVFFVLVVVTTVVPLWSRMFGKKAKEKSTKANYVFATGAVSIFSMMLSIARGTLGVRSFLGFPSEIFYRGAGMWETLYGMVNAYPIVAFVFIPVYFNLGLTSIYQYIELRFKSRLVRCLASGTYIFRTILNLGVTIFTPTIALYTIIGVPIWLSLVTISVISILFNLLGGLKAAITADVIQVVVTIVVSAAIIIQSTILAGGVSEVYNENRDTGRLDFFKFTGDVTVRVDTTSAWLGQLFMSVSLFGCQQNFVQRYLSMKSVNEVTKMLMANIPVIIVLFSLSWVVGMGIFSVYSDCDPLRAGFTKSADAILPFYVEDKYSFVPGLIGIFLATLFNSALILNVSNMNSLATVTWEDFLSKLPRFANKKDSKQLKIIKIIGTVYGLMIMCVGFSVQLLSGVIECAQLMTSATSGPLLGVFILAILVPIANWKGAAAGMIASHVVIMAITAGHLMMDTSVQFLETSIEGCTNESFSSAIVSTSSEFYAQLQQQKPWIVSAINATADNLVGPAVTTTKSFYDYDFPENLFSISYMYYSFFGTLITVFVGILVSCLTRSDADAYDSKFIHPMIYKFTRLFRNSERLFSNEQANSSEIKNTSLKEAREASGEHDNKGFEAHGEEILGNKVKMGSINESETAVNFKSNIVYGKELNYTEKYKKLDES